MEQKRLKRHLFADTPDVDSAGMAAPDRTAKKVFSDAFFVSESALLSLAERINVYFCLCQQNGCGNLSKIL